MLDREVVKEFLKEQFTELKIHKPKNISIDVLTETFCRYTEDDYYEWLKDNFKSFFEDEPDWDWIRGRIVKYSSE